MIFKNLNNKFKKGFGYYIVYLFLWLTFSIGVLRFFDDIKNLSGAINYWNIFLFLAIISYQDCLRFGSKKYYKFLGTILLELKRLPQSVLVISWVSYCFGQAYQFTKNFIFY